MEFCRRYTVIFLDYYTYNIDNNKLQFLLLMLFFKKNFYFICSSLNFYYNEKWIPPCRIWTCIDTYNIGNNMIVPYRFFLFLKTISWHVIVNCEITRYLKRIM